MKFQEHIIDVTRKAAEEVFRYALVVPQDKVEWKPLEKGRSVLDLCRELAKTPDWAYETLDSDREEAPQGDAAADYHTEVNAWTSVEQCHQECLKRLERFFDLVRSIPDEDLSKTRFLPYEGGRDFTFQEMMDYPRWNFNYHLGQIGYIQLLYGDKEMY